eukprot:m.259311 g.259311  ORF g.259311 m.259311 type:complete len:441 (-) comp26635_c0_seq27:1358-2680(-)
MADDGMEAEGLGSESPEREELAQALALSMNLDDEHAATAAAAAPAATAAAAPVAAVAPTRGAPPPERRGRGRPKGSKNKSKEPQAPGDDDVIEIDEREIDEAALEEEAITWVMMRMEDFKGAKALKGKHIRTFERRLEKLYVTRMVNGHAVTFEEVLNLAKKTKDADVKVAAPPRTSEAEDLYLELVAVCERELARLEGAGYEKLSFDLGASDPFADLTGKVGNLVFEVEIVTRAKESQKGADLISRLNRVALGRLVLARRMHAKDATTRQGYLAWLKSPGIELSPPFAYECSVMAGIFMCIPNVVRTPHAQRWCAALPIACHHPPPHTVSPPPADLHGPPRSAAVLPGPAADALRQEREGALGGAPDAVPRRGDQARRVDDVVPRVQGQADAGDVRGTGPDQVVQALGADREGAQRRVPALGRRAPGVDPQVEEAAARG